MRDFREWAEEKVITSPDRVLGLVPEKVMLDGVVITVLNWVEEGKKKK